MSRTSSVSKKTVSTTSGKFEIVTSAASVLSNTCHREDVLRRAENVGRDHLISVGVCFGKFTKTLKFKLHVTALDHLAQYAKVIWFSAFFALSGLLLGSTLILSPPSSLVQNMAQTNCRDVLLVWESRAQGTRSQDD